MSANTAARSSTTAGDGSAARVLGAESASKTDGTVDVRTSSDDEDEGGGDFGMFQEPDSFRPGTPPSTRAHWELRIPPSASEKSDGEHQQQQQQDEAAAAAAAVVVPIPLTLVGHSPLWGHLLWPASQHLSTYLASPTRRARFVRGKTVLELGAAAGVPTIACAILGARYVCSTDYPDPDLIRTLEGNVGAWSGREVDELGAGVRTGLVETVGYRWGDDVSDVLSHLSRATGGGGEATYFDTVILSDLIFNHQAHEALLTTCERTTYTPAGWEARWAARRAAVFHTEREERGVVKDADEDGEAIYAGMRESSEGVVDDGALPSDPVPRSTVLVSFTHHRPVLAHRDLAFFARARTLGWECAKVGQWGCEPVFKDDVGDLTKRSTVHAWAMWRV
ncbi:Protein N-terminal and lysine N-methyltransferase efm7 [Tilletia horrida]|nr:Protein N-terminal and lysine N-methyltransferase efm7 [Tilletia horrida]